MIRPDLQRRLRELGVVKGVRELAAPNPRCRMGIENVVAGHFHVTSRGRCFVAETNYPLDYRHGGWALAACLDTPSPSCTISPFVSGGTELTSVDFRQASFLDTETTGLSGGSGTLAFLVGVGYFEGEHFRLRQYFLRDPGDEPAMLEALAELLPRFTLLVSFNGRAFDVPILENRFILDRTPPPFSQLAHLDLLLPARRLWRRCLGSCSLNTLERSILGVVRDQEDVPSYLVPFLYREYLQTGDAHEMKRVLYHNAFDILSLVTLAARLCRIVSAPFSEQERLSGLEWYSLGHWYLTEGRLTEASDAFRLALECELPAQELRAKARASLAQISKRLNRLAEAAAHWERLTEEAPPGTKEHLYAHIELAKYHEWERNDPYAALMWAQEALRSMEYSGSLSGHRAVLEDLQRRLRRLEQKAERARLRDTDDSQRTTFRRPLDALCEMDALAPDTSVGTDGT